MCFVNVGWLFTAWTAELALKDSLSCSWCGVAYHCWDGLYTPGLSRGVGATSVTVVLCSFQGADGGPCRTPSPASLQERTEKQRGREYGRQGLVACWAGRALWLVGVADWMRNAHCSRRELGGCQSHHVSQVCCRETPQSLSSAS